MKLLRPDQVSGMNIHYNSILWNIFWNPRCGPVLRPSNYGLVLLIFS